MPSGGRQCRTVVADQDLLKGILTNLLENAAEAAGEGGRILGVNRRSQRAAWPSKCTIPGRD